MLKRVNDVKLIYLYFCVWMFSVCGFLYMVCFILIPLLLSSYAFHPFTHSCLIPKCIKLLSLPFSLLALLSLPPLSFPFFSSCLTSLTSSRHPCFPLMLSSVSLYSYPSSLISSVFLSPVMLSSLPSYPSRLISSHPTFPLILSSISPFVSLVTLLTAYHRLFWLNSVTFRNQQAAVSAVKTH